MARAVGGIFGSVTGKIGDYSIRIRNGKTIISARPKNFKASQAPKCIETRQKFAVTSSFTRIILSLSDLKEIWNMNKGSNSQAFNTIFKNNFSLSSAQSPTINNIITPYGFHSPVSGAAITADKLTGSLIEMSSYKSISFNETNLSINAVVCLSGRKVEGDPFYKIISLSKDIPGYDFNKQYDFEIDFDTEQAALIAKYNQKIIYLTVVTKSSENNIVNYSRSYSKIAE